MHKRNRRPAGGSSWLRIIGGQWRGRKLPVPDLPGLRPTPDRVRETLFNWLSPDIVELRCLDLFAGTGALGFEALSRGARQAVMVEQHPRAVQALRDSANTLQAAADIRQGDALGVLAQLSGQFDLVFVDPPFALELWDRVLAALPPHLAAGHRVYVEAPAAWPGPQDPAWETLKEKRAADVVFRLLHYSAPSNQPSLCGEDE